MSNSSGRQDHTFDRFVGVALLVCGGISMLSPDTSSWLLEKLLAFGMLGGGVYVMATSKGGLKVMGGIILALAGGNLLINAGAGLFVLALALGLYFCYSGLQLVRKAETDEEGKWLKMNGTVTIILGAAMLWQWGDATTTIIGILVGIKLLMLGLYHNSKANMTAKAAQ